MYSIYADLRDKLGMSDYEFAQKTGVGRSILSDWKTGKHSPNKKNLSIIANYLGVSMEYLMTGQESEKESEEGNKYYFSDETAEMAQELFENSDMRILFDAAKDSKPQDLKMAADFLKRLKETNSDG